VHLVGFTIEIYHDARSYKRQIRADVCLHHNEYAVRIKILCGPPGRPACRPTNPCNKKVNFKDSAGHLCGYEDSNFIILS